MLFIFLVNSNYNEHYDYSQLFIYENIYIYKYFLMSAIIFLI